MSGCFREKYCTLIIDNILSSEAGAVILKIAYGYTIEPHKRDRLIHIANLALEHFSIAGTPGAWLVDMIPARKPLHILVKPSKVTIFPSEIRSSLVPRS